MADVWLGATDQVTEDVWLWVTGASIDPYVNWRSGEPSNSGGIEHCMVLEDDTLDATWDDRPCDEDYPLLCERD